MMQVQKQDTLQENYEEKGYLEEDFRMFYLTDKGFGKYENHYHTFDKIIIFLKGKVNYMVEGKAYELVPYDIVLVGHHDVHKLMIASGTEYERIIMYIAPEFLTKYSEESYQMDACFTVARREHSNVIRIPNWTKSKLYSTVMEIRQNLRLDSEADEYAKELYHRLLFLEFMVHLNRAVIGRRAEYVNTNICNQKIIGILDYINENLTDELSIDELAAKFYVSKYHMMRLFKEETGYSIGSYISNKRLLRAKELILQGVPITQACFDCGFKEHSTFSRAYKKLFGDSPRKMKQKGGKSF